MSNNADITQYKLAPPIAIELYGKIKANWPALRNTHTSSYLSCCCFFAYWVQENLTESDKCFIQFLGQSLTQFSTLYWGCITESCDHDHMTVAPQIWQFVCSSEVFHCYIWRYSNRYYQRSWHYAVKNLIYNRTLNGTLLRRQCYSFANVLL